MSKKTMQYNSIIAGNFMQPLALLVERLVSKHRPGIEGKANEHETDWTISSILLAVVMLESWLMWVRTVRLTDDQYPKLEADDLYTALRADRCQLPDVREAFVARNVIAHNHIWTTTLEWASESETRHVGSELLFPSTDRKGPNRPVSSKYAEVVDISIMRTRTHQIRVHPKQMDRSDTKKVMQLVQSALSGLVREDLLLPQALAKSAFLRPRGRPAHKGTEAHSLQDLIDLI